MTITRTNPVAIVTGAGQGIGKGITRYLLEKGWRVAMGELDQEAGEETLAEYTPLGEVAFIHADVTDEGSVVNLITESMNHFGRVDALINNAGLAFPGRTPVEELELDAWNRMIATNLTGPMLCAKYAAHHLRKTRGAIVNIASTRAFQSEANTEAYSASKGGIVALSHALAISLGPEVRVNCISPGWINTLDWKKTSRRKVMEFRPIDHEQHPVGRVGVPSDVAALAAFLISDEAAFITGQNFIVDGGMMVKMYYQ